MNTTSAYKGEVGLGLLEVAEDGRKETEDTTPCKHSSEGRQENNPGLPEGRF